MRYREWWWNVKVWKREVEYDKVWEDDQSGDQLWLEHHGTGNEGVWKEIKRNDQVWMIRVFYVVCRDVLGEENRSVVLHCHKMYSLK